MPPALDDVPSLTDDGTNFDLIAHGHRDLVQAVAFNAYGDRCATGSVDGKIRVFNRQKDGTWRMCDNWGAHTGEVLELQWLPPTIYPNLVASLGIEGRFKLWAEDDAAAPGRRFSSRGSNPRAAFESRSNRSPYRSFSVKHSEETRYTYFAFLAADGHLSVNESEEPENLSDYTRLDDFQALPKPPRGAEAGLRVRFDPNPEPCYRALRSGVAPDALGLVVAGLDTVRVFRTRDVVTSSFGAATRAREFYLAAEISCGAPAPSSGVLPSPAAGVHRGLVRDVAWAPGNYRGYDMVATACQDGFVRVFRIDTPQRDDNSSSNSGSNSSAGNAGGARSWAVADITGRTAAGGVDNSGGGGGVGGGSSSRRPTTENGGSSAGQGGQQNPHGQHAAPHHPHSGIRAEIDKSGTHGERVNSGQPGQVVHTVRELSKLESHRSPVWRVGFDDDGQILASVGDEGKLICYRQKPDGTWAKSSELGMMKQKLVVPQNVTG